MKLRKMIYQQQMLFPINKLHLPVFFSFPQTFRQYRYHLVQKPFLLLLSFLYQLYIYMYICDTESSNHQPSFIPITIMEYKYTIHIYIYIYFFFSCLCAFVPQIISCLRALIFTCLCGYNHSQNILRLTSVPCIAVFLWVIGPFVLFNTPKQIPASKTA